MCAIAMGTAMPRTPEPQTHGEKASLKVRFRGKAFLLICVQMLRVCAKKKKNVYHSFRSLDIYNLKSTPLQRLLPLRLVTLVSLIQLCTINLTSLSVCDNPTSLFSCMY